MKTARLSMCGDVKIISKVKIARIKLINRGDGRLYPEESVYYLLF